MRAAVLGGNSGTVAKGIYNAISVAELIRFIGIGCIIVLPCFAIDEIAKLNSAVHRESQGRLERSGLQLLHGDGIPAIAFDD